MFLMNTWRSTSVCGCAGLLSTEPGLHAILYSSGCLFSFLLFVFIFKIALYYCSREVQFGSVQFGFLINKKLYPTCICMVFSCIGLNEFDPEHFETKTHRKEEQRKD